MMNLFNQRLPILGLIFRKEIKEILRDKRIIFATVVFPILIYPFIFFGIHKLEQYQRDKVTREGIFIACNAQKDLLNAMFSGSEYPFTFLSTHAPEQAVLDKTAQIGLSISKDGKKGSYEIWYFYNGSEDKSLLAVKEFHDVIQQKRIDWILHHLTGGRPGEKLVNPVSFKEIDVASSEARSGHMIGKILPFILILMLISGCSYTAVDLIAGEKERGSLETLLVTPVWRQEIVAGKFLVVLASGFVSVFLNFIGIYASLKAGLIASIKSYEFQLDPFALLVILLFTIPLAVLFSACLMIFTAKAKSFQEGQVYLLPFSLLALVPTLAAVLPGMSSDSFLVVLPVANIVIGIREILEGTYKIPYLILGNLINCFYAAGALWAAVRYLDKEGTLVSSHISDADLGRSDRFLVRGGLLSFLVTWLVMFYVMSPLQAKYPKLGLAVTLYGLILGAAFWHLHRYKLPIRGTLMLNRPEPLSWLAVVSITAGMILSINQLMVLQSRFLPVPENAFKAFEYLFFEVDLPVVLGIFLFAVSPGICEEVLFRGALQGGFMRAVKPYQAILMSSVLFGLIHFSVYRFLPTCLLGVIFGYLAYRYQSIFVAMFAHALYNGVLLNILVRYEKNLPQWIWAPGLVLALTGLFLTRIGTGRFDRKKGMMR